MQLETRPMSDPRNSTSPRPVIRHAGEGETLSKGAETLVLTLTGEDTDGGFALIRRTVSPHFQSPPKPHANTAEDWMCHLLSGRLVVQLESGPVELRAGSTIFMPRGTYFRWWNPDAAAAEALFLYTPAGFENFFRRLFETVPPDAKQLHDWDKTLPEALAANDAFNVVRKS